MVGNITNNAKENTKVFCKSRDKFSVRFFILNFALKPVMTLRSVDGSVAAYFDIERNSVRGGMVEGASGYRGSSHGVRALGKADELIQYILTTSLLVQLTRLGKRPIKCCLERIIGSDS